MGALTSRQHAGVEEIDIVSNHAYKYPPRSGNYFGSHFIMGGERFDTPQPESYLFGENSDLNFLGSRPTPFPYPPPQPNEPTKTLKSLVNIRKESLRFVRAPPEYGKLHLDRGDADAGDVELGRNTPFNMEFTFDCDVRCSITIYYFCTEEFTPNGVSYISKDPNLTSETYHYKRGANQQFCQMSHAFNPSRYTDQELLYDIDREIIPIAIHCVAEEGPEDMRQSHTTIATVEKSADGSYVLKALKQKLFVDGLCYLLQEIYGIENKNSDKTDDDEGEDNGSECVICMCDVRDTLILPCRHLCLCNSCGDSLRYQANNCPICRAPFRALLQIRALQKSTNPMQPPVSPPDASCDNIPPGYEAVSLIEALNGPCITRQPPAAMPDLVETPDNDPAVQAAQILNRHLEKTNKTGKDVAATTPEFGMSVLTGGQDEESKELQQRCPLLVNEGESNLRSKHSRSRDTVRHINERSENEGCDDDSEAEKLSPLLKKAESPNFNSLALNVADVTEPIDDAFSDKEDKQQMQNPDRKSPRSLTEERGDESDYYTPEEGAPISSALYDSNPGPVSSVDSTPQRLPGTPMSHASARSSADSYTSGSSTKHLLVTANNCSSDKAVRI